MVGIGRMEIIVLLLGAACTVIVPLTVVLIVVLANPKPPTGPTGNT